MSTPQVLMQAAYLAAAVCFILGMRGLSRADDARRGMQLAATGMLLAVLGTLFHQGIVRWEYIIGGMLVGTVLGVPLGTRVPMTAVPQQIAISHGFGALAATLVGINEFIAHGMGEGIGRVTMSALGLETFFGGLTVTGSVLAFMKLHELMPTRPITWPGQNFMTFGLFGGIVVVLGMLIIDPAQPMLFWILVGAALLAGVLLVLPIGGADMPVVVSLLNAYAGLAGAATGFALDNNVLIVCGALNGASGFLLSMLMSKAMNRSFGNVLFGAFGATVTSGGGKSSAGLTVRQVSAEDAAMRLAYAGNVVIVPGYGMAVAQAQHVVRELGELIEENGGTVRYAIHPVAGRMPGHMNVLLAEANIPYDALHDMEDINDQFESVDVVVVIGANDVVNPAARTDTSSPIYGMPILNADRARSVIVLKRGMNPGFAGIENELFYDPRTAMLFGDAKASLVKVVAEIKAL